jgi:guanyl-specific ribonuclease Sa
VTLNFVYSAIGFEFVGGPTMPFPVKLGQGRTSEPVPAPPAAPQKAYDTLKEVESTGSAPQGHVGGRRFQNDGRGGGQVLPKQAAEGSAIHYQEWDVNPKQAGVNRGSERLVTGSDGSAYYTGDHYRTFTKIK